MHVRSCPTEGQWLGRRALNRGMAGKEASRTRNTGTGPAVAVALMGGGAGYQRTFAGLTLAAHGSYEAIN